MKKLALTFSTFYTIYIVFYIIPSKANSYLKNRELRKKFNGTFEKRAKIRITIDLETANGKSVSVSAHAEKAPNDKLIKNTKKFTKKLQEKAKKFVKKLTKRLEKKFREQLQNARRRKTRRLKRRKDNKKTKSKKRVKKKRKNIKIQRKRKRKRRKRKAKKKKRRERKRFKSKKMHSRKAKKKNTRKHKLKKIIKYVGDAESKPESHGLRIPLTFSNKSKDHKPNLSIENVTKVNFGLNSDGKNLHGNSTMKDNNQNAVENKVNDSDVNKNNKTGDSTTNTQNNTNRGEEKEMRFNKARKAKDKDNKSENSNNIEKVKNNTSKDSYQLQTDNQKANFEISSGSGQFSGDDNTSGNGSGENTKNSDHSEHVIIINTVNSTKTPMNMNRTKNNALVGAKVNVLPVYRSGTNDTEKEKHPVNHPVNPISDHKESNPLQVVKVRY